jgi:hypothetical protein
MRFARIKYRDSADDGTAGNANRDFARVLRWMKHGWQMS